MDAFNQNKEYLGWVWPACGSCRDQEAHKAKEGKLIG